ncbi:MAG: esterase family protein [Faecalibacterium sp.]
MLQGTYYKEWSTVLDRAMEFKVYGRTGVPVLALPTRGGRFYDWENNGMPDAAAGLLDTGRIQLFCADSIDSESLLAGDKSPRRRAEMQEAYFNYLTRELAPRILELNAAGTPVVLPLDDKEDKPAKKPVKLWCAGADLGAYQAVNCRLRRPQLFAGAVALSGLYDMGRFLGGAEDDLALRNSPLAYLPQDGLIDTAAFAQDTENSLLLCAGQGPSENEALQSTHALEAALKAAGIPCHFEAWGNDVSHDWYWWGKEWGLFAQRIFG